MFFIRCELGKTVCISTRAVQNPVKNKNKAADRKSDMQNFSPNMTLWYKMVSNFYLDMEGNLYCLKYFPVLKSMFLALF